MLKLTHLDSFSFHHRHHCHLCLQGVGSAQDIDVTMKLGTNVPMGPLTLADFIGLDTVSAFLKMEKRKKTYGT